MAAAGKRRAGFVRDTFRQMAKSYPAIAPLHELRHALSEMRLNDLAVGRDGRNRTIFRAFRAKTGRNQPSNTKFIFGPSVWLRGLIKPPPGHAVAYVDWSNQEFGIAAKLSGDEPMMAAYQSGDPYLAFGKQCGEAAAGRDEEHRTRDTRHMLKGCVLGIQYGMEAKTLACRIGQPPIVARDLLRAHRETYSKFWRWSDAAVDHAMLSGTLHTVFGWHVHVGDNPTRARCEIFRCRPTAPRCCGWRAAWRPSAASRSARRCTMPLLICAPIERIDNDVDGCARPWTKPRARCSTASKYGPTSTSSAIQTATWTRAAA